MDPADQTKTWVSEGRVRFIERSVAAFQQALARGERPALERFLEQTPRGSLKRELLRALLRADWDHQRQKGGKPAVEWYLAKHADYADVITETYRHWTEEQQRPQPAPPPAAPSAAAPAKAEEPWVQAYYSSDFGAWLANQNISLAFSTYQTGKLFLIGRREDGQLAIFERTFNHCMGLWGDGQTLWLSSLFQLWRFVNVLRPGQRHEGHDALYVPRAGYTTGNLDTHDVAVEASGRVVFVNTKFGCLATLHERDSFTPLWRPKFLSALVPEDRCHLNGLALEDGRVRYVTAVSTSDVVDGWRDRRRDGGVVIDVQNDNVIAEGLSMPHSPRVYRGRLWLLNSGSGELGWIDNATGKFEPLTFCPGYLRGLAFAGDYAVVGLSRPRHDKTFGGLPLQEKLAAKGAEARSGLHIIDLRSGTTIHWLRVEGMVSELYDVAVLPGIVRPMSLGFKSDEIQRLLTMSEMGNL